MTLDSEIERLGEQTDDLRTNGAQVTTTAAVSQPSGLTGTEAMIDVEGVGKAFGSVQALVDVSLRVQAGRVVGLLGPNGLRPRQGGGPGRSRDCFGWEHH